MTLESGRSLRDTLSSLVHGDSYRKLQPRLGEIFSPDVFARPSGLSEQERYSLTYERLRHINGMVDTSTPLLRQRELLFPLLEWAAMADPSLFYAFFLHHCTTIGSVLEFGKDRDDLDDLLAELASTSVVGALLMTELGHGNSNAAVRTEAVYDRDHNEFVLTTPGPEAVKYPPSVGAEGVARTGIVTARLKVGEQDCGLFCFVVPIRDSEGACQGVRIEPQDSPSILPLDWAVVSFDGVRVPYRYWLRDSASISNDGTFTDALSTPALRSRQASRLIRYVWEGAAVGLAAVARGSAAIAVRHAHERLTNGTFAGNFASAMPVIRYRNQQRTLFGALSSAFVAAMAAKVIASPDPMPQTAGAIRTVFTLKAAIDQIAERVTIASREASGVLGFSPQNRFLDYQGLAHSFNAAGLSSQVLYLNAAWTMALGLDYQAPADDPLPPGDRSLRDPAVWSLLTTARERRLHEELVDELGKARADGLSEFDAWNDRFDLAERMAQAHAARLLVGVIRTEVDALAEPRAKEVARTVCALHVLTEIMTHSGWYLAEGLLTAAEARSLPALLNELCAEIAPNALDLADALDVPYEIVGAPIAQADYASAFTNVAAAGPLG
ncbi:acyl-CoA dehydrogenase [Streptomyces sp. CB03911]|uniref:acyl-CoA dehydrogenase n=1 Tax=Streptomyces sp. CB03911 TaxID=1804758 RepID=UPI0009A134FE|nr:acyl-CoA dehydrogenase [Streptomyces sp. CB03911]